MADYSMSLDGIPVPLRISRLPVCPIRKVPVPWFVAWIDGRPEFRTADPAKWNRAVAERLCWVCGGKLKVWELAFVVGPVCVVNRTTAEPPCHPECAAFSARACPFLTRPHMRRREHDLPEGHRPPPGEFIRRNPGCCAVYHCRTYSLFGDGKGGVLIELGEPTGVDWYAGGRPATRAEVLASIDTGLPLLRTECGRVAAAAAELEKMLAAAQLLLPAA